MKSSFTQLRLIAASLVIVSHSYPLTKNPEPLNSFLKYFGSNSDFNIGLISVCFFIALSGILMIKTWQKNPSAKIFYQNRILRIMPGYLFQIYVVVSIAGFFSALGFNQYLKNPETWDYIQRNASLYNLSFSLPGVFKDNPYPSVVNGSLWTMPYEVLFYILFPIVFLNKRIMWPSLALIFCAMIYFFSSSIVLGFIPKYLVLLGSCFIGGALHELYKLRFNPYISLVFTFVGIYYFNAIGAIIIGIFVPSLILKLSDLFKGDLKVDLSYGVYLYGFFVEQSLVYLGFTQTYLLAFLALIISSILASLSWYLVESNALKLKSK